MDVQATFFATVLDEWVRCGLTDAVIGPGQRSTLFVAQLEQHPGIRTHVMVDERSGSFFALGLGIATGRPALFWCTSGTAAAEAHAAVIESHHAEVPLLVCTTNRPPELQHARDWQSIDQSRLYGGITRWQFSPGVAVPEMTSSWRSIAARAVAETLHHPQGPGPVHLDLAIREPWQMEVGELPEGRPDGRAWHRHHAVRRQPQADVVEQLATAGRRGVIVVGRADVDPDAVHACAEALAWPVVADLRSGCRVPRPNTVTAFDGMLRSDTFVGRMQPEIVLRFGNQPLSKLVPAWIRASGAEEWLVDPYDVWTESVVDASHVVQADAAPLCRAIAKTASGSGAAGWLESWQLRQRAACEAITGVLNAHSGVSEPAAGAALVESLPDGANLFAATSMPVRDVEWYGPARANLHVYANRGASGMDGLTSTAAAVSLGTQRPTVLLVGDLSFLYDLNALWTLRGAVEPVDLTIVLVDNDGGGIFSGFTFLRELGDDVFERVVATPQQVDARIVAESFGVKSETVQAMADFAPAVGRALDDGGIRMVYVHTDRQQMVEIRNRIHAEIRKAVEACISQA